MKEPVIAQKSSYQVELEEGKTYYWCSCGRSKNQPFCDGSHEGTEFKPVAFTAEKTGTVGICGSKHTANPSYCDETHRKL